MAEIEFAEACVAARVPIILVDEFILAAIGIPEMLLGLRELPAAAPFRRSNARSAVAFA